MNAHGVFVLSALLVNFFLNLVADVLNIQALSPIIPTEFKEVYDAEAYAKSQRYTRAKTIFSQFSRVYELACFCGIWWYLAGFDRLDRFVANFADNFIVQGIAFIQAYALLDGVLSLPLELYHTFVLEEKFGFNKTTLSTFFIDRVKAVVLALLLGTPLLAAILWFLEHTGPQAWLYCWGAGTAFSLVVTALLPAVILPLFYKLTPLAEGDLKQAINQLAQKLNFAFGGIFEMDGSSRSSHSNAFFAGFGSTKRIVLFDTLVSSHSIPELLAVLAHEIGHYKMRHILHGLVFSSLNLALVFYTTASLLASGPLFEAFGVSRLSLHVGLVLAQAMLAPLALLASILRSIRSRQHEFEADAYSVKNYGNGTELISALKKLSKENLGNLTPHWLIVFLTYSHPPMLQRIQAIRDLGVKKQ